MKSSDQRRLEGWTPFENLNAIIGVYYVLVVFQVLLSFISFFLLLFNAETYNIYYNNWQQFIRKKRKDFRTITEIDELHWLKNPDLMTASDFNLLLMTRGYKNPLLHISKKYSFKSHYFLRQKVKISNFFFNLVSKFRPIYTIFISFFAIQDSLDPFLILAFALQAYFIRFSLLFKFYFKF